MEEKLLCDLCLDVLSGTCKEEERRSFELHLPGCEACQAEMEELRIIWEAISTDMERIEPPEDLKQQVMDAALAADKQSHEWRARPGWRNIVTRPNQLIAAAVFLLLLTASTLWNISLYRERSALPIPIEQALNVPAAEIQQLVPLKPVKQEGRAYGLACVVGSGTNKQFVVYLFDAAPTTGEEAYQVWLLKDGARRSAGTMRVSSESGIGLLAMPITSETLDFDSIGITLEPDDRGAQPRGEKMFGST